MWNSTVPSASAFMSSGMRLAGFFDVAAGERQQRADTDHRSLADRPSENQLALLAGERDALAFLALGRQLDRRGGIDGAGGGTGYLSTATVNST